MVRSGDKILAIDTSLQQCSAAVIDFDSVSGTPTPLATQSIDLEKGHAPALVQVGRNRFEGLVAPTSSLQWH